MAGPASGAAVGVVTDAGERLMRGGAFAHDPLVIQSLHSFAMPPTERGGDMGLRPARTVP